MRTWVVLLAVALVACQTSPAAQSSAPRKGPTGPLGDVLAQAASLAASTTVTDARFQNFIELLDFDKQFGAQAGAVRAAIANTRANASKGKKAAVFGGRLASVAAVLGEFTIEYLATKLSASLDPFTKTSGSLPATPTHTTDTESDNATTTVTTLDVTETTSSQGDRVQIELDWKYRTVVQDVKTATISMNITDERTAVAAIKVCPDEQGQVFATMDVTSNFVGTSPTGTVSVAAKSSSVFTGHVDDNAALTSVSQTMQDKESWVTASGGYDFDATISLDASANPQGGFLSARDEGSTQGNVHVSDTTKLDMLARATKALGAVLTLDAESLEKSYQEAQRLWRNGRCVVVTVPDYSAETPIEVVDQNKIQHDEPVQPSEEKKFKADLKHRFSGIVKAKINASLSGDKKLEPNLIETPPGQLTYTAPEEQKKEATVTLKSTSRRGIGTLVIKFHTEGQALTLNLKGTNTIGPQQKQLVTTLSIGPATFKKGDGDTWTATAPFTGTSKLVPPEKDCADLVIAETGSMNFTAMVETKGNDKFWVVHSNGTGNTSVKASGCDTAADYASGLFGGLGSGLFIGAIGDITIPYDGGTVQVSGANAGGGRASGTAVGTIEKK
jgi:hypothetical protein